MKSSLRPLPAKTLTLGLLACVLGLTGFGQGMTFTYQGRLSTNGIPAGGTNDFVFTVMNAASGGSQIGSAVVVDDLPISNGLFTVSLNIGPGVFDGSPRWLQISLRPGSSVGGYTALSPRQPITATPYAITASNLSGTLPADQITGTLPSTSLLGTYGFPVTFNNGGNNFTGSGSGLVNLNPAAILWGSCPPWSICGNAGTIAGLNFVGTTDNQPLEFKVNGQRAFRLEPGSKPNVIGGSINNMMSFGVGATIGGGDSNKITGNGVIEGDTIGGGIGNSIRDYIGGGTTIGGGQQNLVTYGDGGAVGGGYGNIIDSFFDSTIGGGRSNRVGDFFGQGLFYGGSGTIGGGSGNYMVQWLGTISGGAGNRIEGGPPRLFLGGTIGGGAENIIRTATDYATVGGGFQNIVNGDYAAISGGRANEIRIAPAFQVSPTNSFIGGGASNVIYVGASVIGGGIENKIGSESSQAYETGHAIGGGIQNRINYENRFSTISGGRSNFVDASSAIIGGGNGNRILFTGGAGSSGDVIGGGGQNEIGTGAVLGHAVISGGISNRVNGNYGTIPGGDRNAVTNYAFAAGRRAKANHVGTFVWADSTDADFASTANNQFLIRAAGGVGIGRAPTANALEVEGNVSKTTAGSWLANSDERIKQDIQPVRSALETLAKIRPVSFRYTDDYRKQHPGVDDRRYLNVVAQEFREVFPDEVKSSGEKLPDGSAILQVDTYPLTIYSAAAIQELNVKLKAKDSQIRELERRLEKLEQRMDQKPDGDR